MALSKRYQPQPPAQNTQIAIDYSFILPPGVGIATGTVNAFTNTNPANATSDLTFGPVSVIRGRVMWVEVSGGIEGTDYIIQWTATDTVGNVWPRGVLMLCARTS